MLYLMATSSVSYSDAIQWLSLSQPYLSSVLRAMSSYQPSDKEASSGLLSQAQPPTLSGEVRK